jgi:hypothetical protein
MRKNEDISITENVSTKLSRDERELILLFNEGDGVWQAESSIPKWWRKLEAKNWKCVKTAYYDDGTVCSKCFVGSKKGVSITDPFKTREISDDQREAARQRFSARKESNDKPE